MWTRLFHQDLPPSHVSPAQRATMALRHHARGKSQPALIHVVYIGLWHSVCAEVTRSAELLSSRVSAQPLALLHVSAHYSDTSHEVGSQPRELPK